MREKQAGNCLLHITDPIQTKRCLNLGSYNYLGFADDWKNTCGEDVLNSVKKWPVGVCATRKDGGTTTVHKELERMVADFLGKEDCIA
jgi:serine palmitoyltransferase